MSPRGDTSAASFGGRGLTEAPESENKNQRSNQHRFLLVGPLRRALVVVKITIWTPPVIPLNPFPVPVVAFDVDAIAGACVRGLSSRWVIQSGGVHLGKWSLCFALSWFRFSDRGGSL